MKTFKQYLRYLGELTISPDYVMKGIENPFYDLDIDIQKDIIPAVGDGKIKFKNTRKPSGTLIKNYGGKFHFQINKDDEDIDKYITTTKKMVKSHLGQKQRKNATASSNVNEYLTVHFIVHRNFTTPEDFMADIGDMNGTTGVLLADGKPVTYEKLRQLIDEDETAIRDINIGYQNSLAVIEDLKGKAIDKLYWVPKGKPEGVGQKNPSDVIIKLTDGSFIGYSNKISSGADKTPKINTTITAYYEKLKDTRQLRSIHNMTHDAWNYAKSLVPKDKKIASTAINNFIIEREKFSETSSKMAFARLSKSFRQDRLNFYTNDYYYPFRNKMIELFSNHISESRNLTYFLNTVGYYT